MPTAPSWITKVNYVINFWTDPCHAPMIVYLELAAAPAGRAVITWFTFGLADVLRGYARPSKALGGRPTKRRGKRKTRKWKIFKLSNKGFYFARFVPGLGDDTGGWLGKRLPGAREFKGRQISQGAINFWVLDDVGQRVLLALLIADIAIDFAYDWATLLDESVFCQRSSVGSLYATGPGTAAGGIIPCRAGSAPDVLWQEGDVGWNISTGSVGPRGWNAASAMTVKNVSLNPVTHYQQAFVVDGLGTRTIFSETQTIQPGASAGSVVSVPLVGPGSFVISHCCFGGAVQPEGHDVAIWGGGNQ